MEVSISKVLGQAHAKAGALYGLIKDEAAANLRKWQEEKPAREQLIGSLSQGQEILKKEKKRQAKELQEKLDRLASASKQPATPASVIQDSAIEELQHKLVVLNNRVLDVDLAIGDSNNELQQCHPSERDLVSSKLVCLEDTKRILTDEVNILRSNIFRIENVAKAEADKKNAEELGWADLARLEEQLVRTAARIDKVKLSEYFPEVKGYRFSAGNAGVYFAAKDLFFSEISGRFEFNLDPVELPDGGKGARLSIALGGVSATQSWPESRPSLSRVSSQVQRDNEGSQGGNLHRRSSRAGSNSSIGGTPATVERGSAGVSSKSHGGIPSAPAVSHRPNASGGGGLNAGGQVPLRSSLEELPQPAESDTSTHSAESPPAAARPPLGSTSSLDNASPGGLGSSLASSTGPLRSFQSEPTPGGPQHGSAPGTESWNDPLQALPADLYGAGKMADVDSGSMGVAGRGGSASGQGPLAADTRGAASTAGRSTLDLPAMPHTSAGLASQQHATLRSSQSAQYNQQAATSSLGPSGSSSHSNPRSQTMDARPGVLHHTRTEKGEGVANFLSGLSKQKDKLKDKLKKMSGPSSPGGGQEGGERLHGMKERMKETLGEVKGKVKDTVGEVKDKMKDTVGDLTEGLHEGKGKLSKLARAIANKAPGSVKTKGSAGTSDVPLSRSSDPEAFSPHAASAGTAHAMQSAILESYLDDVPGSAPTASGGLQSQASAGSNTSQGIEGMPMPSEASTSSTSRIQQQSSGGLSDAPPSDFGEEADSVAFEEFEPQPSRKGVYLQLLGENVEVIGERGTKVPDISMRELLIEVEVVLTALLLYNPVAGWQVPDEKVDFNILLLEHKTRGTTIPLPKAALKALLNLYLPGAITKLFLSALPVELGQYVVESGETMQLSGEFRLMGQSLPTYVADLAPSHKAVDSSKRATWQQAQAAGARARSMLGLTELQAQALHGLFSGRACITETPRPLSICELCRYYVQYRNSELWPALCTIWDKAILGIFQYYSVPEKDLLSFGRFMDGPVARLVRKPVRVAFTISNLQVAIDVDAALNTLKALFERLARDFHKKSQAGAEPTVPREPLEVQLENLALWHQALAMTLRSFKTTFRFASCALLAAADKEVFQFGAENVTYDGPLKLKIPLDVMMDPDNSFLYDVKLPDRNEYAQSMTTMLQEIMFNLSGAVGGQEGEVSTFLGGQIPDEKAADLLKRCQEAAAIVSGSGDPDKRRTTLSSSGGSGELTGPVLDNPVIGQVSVRRIALTLKLAEERLAALLMSSAVASQDPQLLSSMLGCYGDLFTTSLDVGWRSDGQDSNSRARRPVCMLTVQNNEVTRVNATVESLMFQSLVSPKKAVRMLHLVVAGLMLKFYTRDSYQMRFYDRVFAQLHDYLNKDALDAMMCISAHAHVVRQPEGAGDGSSKLRVVLAGYQGSGSQGLGNVVPIHVMNDINLMTVLDSFKLLAEG